MAFELACHSHATFAASQQALVAGPFAIRDEAPSDVKAREALLDAAMGPARFLKTCQRLREGSAPVRRDWRSSPRTKTAR